MHILSRMSARGIHAEIAALSTDAENEAFIEKFKTRLLLVKEDLESIEYELQKASREESDAMREFWFATTHRDRLKKESSDWEKHCTERFRQRVNDEVKNTSKECKDAEEKVRTIRLKLQETRKEEAHCRRMLH